MNEPRDLVQRFEKNPQLPEGVGEILAVYGVESCPFASGDILCSRHVLASSFGPAYTAMGHRDPDGDCSSQLIHQQGSLPRGNYDCKVEVASR